MSRRGIDRTIELHHGEGAAYRKELLFEATDQVVVFIKNLDVGNEERDAPFHTDNLLPVRSSYLDIKRGHPLVVGKP